MIFAASFFQLLLIILKSSYLSKKTMFIISLTYKTSLENVERFIPEHNDFLEKYYRSGNFIASGRKEPRTGGIILADAHSKNEVEEIIKEDPFYIHQVADYDITEFFPTKYNEHFKFFIKNP
jgi:uncharacterized protein YciI